MTCPGVPFGRRSPQKRGPYSTPKHSEFGAQFRDVVDVRHLVFLSSCEDESAHGVVSGRVKERGSDRRSRRVGEPKCASILGEPLVLEAG